MLKHQFKEKTLSALMDGLPEGKATPNAGTYSLLRVVAQFPRPVNLKSVFDRDEDHKHPLVTLDTENLKRATQHQFPPYALERFERDEIPPKRKRNQTPEVESDDESDSDDSEVDVHIGRLEDSDNERPRKKVRPNNEEDTAEGDENDVDNV